MMAEGVRRLVAISAGGVGDSRNDAGKGSAKDLAVVEQWLACTNSAPR